MSLFRRRPHSKTNPKSKPGSDERAARDVLPTLRRFSRELSWSRVQLAVSAVLLIVLHMWLFPPARSTQRLSLDVGSITDHEILAPFSFTAPRPARELEAGRRDATQRVAPVFRVMEGAESRTEERMRGLFQMVDQLVASDTTQTRVQIAQLSAAYPDVDPGAWAHVLRPGKLAPLRVAVEQVVRRNLSAGIVDVTPRGTYQHIQLLDPALELETSRPVASVVLGYRLDEALRRDLSGMLREHAAAEAALAIALELQVKNLSYDDAETERRRVAASDAVSVFRQYGRNERILSAGVRVGQDELAVLESMEAARARRELAKDRTIGIRLRLGRILLLSVLLVGLGFLLRQRDRSLLTEPRRAALLFVLLASFLMLSGLVLRNPAWGGAYAVPIVMLAMLSTILFGESSGTRTTVIGILLLSILPGLPLASVIVWACAGAAAVRMVRRVRHRNQFYRAMGVVSLVYVLSVGGAVIAEAGSMAELADQIGRALISGVASTALSLFLLPLFEALFSVSTELTLLELSDLNHPLLRRMSLESPGTYHHSQVVGSLAEAASRAIGGNSLEARVGANFHDIGKMLKPRYYAENQSDGNVHDALSPTMSAIVIAAHVRDGMELGRQWGLPHEVLAYIPEHHGTSVMQYFYKKALEADEGAVVKVDDFRYPGPKPQRRETAIVMLADGAEAATRSLRRVTPSRVREMVRKIIDKRMEEGELDECGLSLSDLASVRDSFVPILVGIHHQRVAYPGQREHEAQKEQESREARSRSRRGGSSVATGS